MALVQQIEPTRGAQVIKISSKRQITIPAKVFKEAGFNEYAVLNWADGSLSIQPLDTPDGLDEETILFIVKKLTDHGYTGDEFDKRFEAAAMLAIEFNKKLEASVSDVEEGRVELFEECQSRMREKYCAE